VGGILGTAAEVLGTKFESEANATMRSLGVDAALESIAKLAPASDTDVQMLLRNKPNAFQNKDSALAFVALMRKVADRYKVPFGAVQAATGGGDVPDGVDPEDWAYMTEDERALWR
jgi:hypothetical protein